MERTAIPGLAHGDAAGISAGRLRELRRRLVPLALGRLAAERWTEAATYAAALGGGAAFASLALWRHSHFESTAYDLGYFDQIIWNTAQGRFFQTSFVSYNFLGLHFQPVLLLFAGLYRLGAGVESLLIVQAAFVGAAAVPLYYAVRRLTGSGTASLAMAIAFLLSARLHEALDFDFHPEMMGFLFVFLALYYLAAGRPLATLISLLPLLGIKEDMFLALVPCAALLFVAGHRRHGFALMLVTVVWTAGLTLVAMPIIRDGDSGLIARYEYLVAGSSVISVVPHVIIRGIEHLRPDLTTALRHLLPSLGIALVLNPLTVLLALPAVLLNGLSDHSPQARLELHYVAVPLAMSWVAVALATRTLAVDGRIAPLARVASPRSRVIAGAGLVLGATVLSFVLASPYAPGVARESPDPAHRQVISQAFALIPGEAPVSAQRTLLPHLSHRQSVYEFPKLAEAEYVVIDSSLPHHSDRYDETARLLVSPDYETVFDSDGVRVFRRLP